MTEPVGILIAGIRSRRLGRGLPPVEQEVLAALFEAFPDAREGEGQRPPGRVLDRVEGPGIVVELVERGSP